MNTSTLCQAPSPSFTSAHNLAEETNAQQIIIMQAVECDSRDRLGMLSGPRQEALNSIRTVKENSWKSLSLLEQQE